MSELLNERKLLCSYEVFNYDPKVIKESTEKNDGKMLVKGILQKADVLNQNGRIYPLAILQREVRNYQKFINENRAIGEIDHPESSVVSLKNASHVVREAYIENGIVYGTVEILYKVPSGAILAGLIESGVKLGISSRGVGSTRKQGDNHVVQDDFQLICWDFVSEPSTTGAFMIPEGVQIPIAEVKRSAKIKKLDELLNDILGSKS
jgi:hypothetical protein